MKNYGPGGEVNARLDTLDIAVININNTISQLETDLNAAIAQLQSELDAEKLWNVNSGTMTIQEDINGPVSEIDMQNKDITGLNTDSSDDSAASNVAFTKSEAIKYSLIF